MTGAHAWRVALRSAAALAIGGAGAAAWAQGQGAAGHDVAYLSVGGGTSVYLAGCDNPSVYPSHAAYPACDRLAGAWRAALGVYLAPAAAIELTVIDFGQARGLWVDVSSDARVQLVGLGSVLPLEFGGGLSGKLRLGLASVRTALQPVPDPFAPAGTRSYNSPQYYGGFSFAYALTRHFALEVAWDFTRADLGLADPRVHALTAGASLRF